MTTKTELEDAFETIADAQKNTFTSAEPIVDAFVTDMTAVLAGYPAPASDPVRQTLARFLSTVTGFKNFEIMTMKSSLGLNPKIDNPPV